MTRLDSNGRRWPKVAHRVRSTEQGIPSSPAPWILLADERVWAWDPTRGLIAVDLGGDHRKRSLTWACLTPDGRRVCYELRSLTADRATVYQQVVHSLTTSTSATRSQTNEHEFWAADGSRLVATYEDHDRGGVPHASRYVLHRQGTTQELPLRDVLGYNFDGATAQFSPDGTRIAVGHRMNGTSHISVVSIEDDAVLRFSEVALATCATWNPAATRLLVSRREDSYPRVLDLATGAETPTSEVIQSHQTPPGLRPVVAGWLSDTEFLVSQVQGRRLLVRVVEEANGQHHEILDVPIPVGPREFVGLVLAAATAQAQPSLVGWLGN